MRGVRLPNHDQVWAESEAQRNFVELMQSARAGHTQLIQARDGVFEVTFKPQADKPRVGELLSRGGPIED